MKQLFALLLILSSFTLTAQNFAEFIRIGDQQYSEGNFEASAQSYEQA